MYQQHIRYIHSGMVGLFSTVLGLGSFCVCYYNLQIVHVFLSRKVIDLSSLHCRSIYSNPKVYKGSLASAGVSLCLYYLAYNEDVLEKVAQLDGATIEGIVE